MARLKNNIVNVPGNFVFDHFSLPFWGFDALLCTVSKLWELVMDREAWWCYSSWGHKELNMTEQLNCALNYGI